MLIEDFARYKLAKSNESKTFRYWDTFVQMFRILSEGFHKRKLELVPPLPPQAILILFAVSDRTNYIRWWSMYAKDVRQMSIQMFKRVSVYRCVS